MSAAPAGAPRFSILVPVLDAAPFIGETLRSIRNQGFASLEVVVMDGGSTDGTLEIVREFSGLDLRLVSERDAGQLDALQKAARLAKGEILHWLNADDVLLPGSLAEVDRVFAADPTLDLVFSDDFAFDAARRVLVNGGLIRGLSCADHLLYYRQMSSECVFWRRAATRYLPPEDYDLRITTDYAFFLNLRPGLNERWLDKRLGAFRMVPGQMSERAIDRHAAEFARVRADARRRLGWSDRETRLRRLVHGPSFALRQVLRPAAYAAARALRRFLDGGRRRKAMTEAFFDGWLKAEGPADEGLIMLLWR